MATKEELQNEVMTLKGRIAELEAAGGGASDWLARAGLMVIGQGEDALLCTAEGLPADGVIMDGVYYTNEVEKGNRLSGDAPALIDTAGNPLVNGGVYVVHFPADGSAMTLSFEGMEGDEVASLQGAVDNGEDVYIYVEGEGFTRVKDGMTVALERWRVRNSDGTFTEPQAGRAYVYDGSHDLVAVATGDLSSVAQENEALKLDKLRLATQVDELRETNAALQRRIDAGAMLHGAIDDLPPVV